MSEQVITYLKEHREHLLQQLNDFLSIPSISTDSAYENDIRKAALFVENYLNEIGIEYVEIQETGGHPLDYAEYNEAGPDAPTVLFYGHYDVQPVDPIDEWECYASKPESQGY